MGWVQGKGARKLPSLGLHDMVWGFGGRNAAQVDGVARGERSLPGEGSIGDTIVWRGTGFNTPHAPGPGDATGVRSGPLAKMAWYYHAHLAISELSTSAELWSLARSCSPAQFSFDCAPDRRIDLWRCSSDILLCIVLSSTSQGAKIMHNLRFGWRPFFCVEFRGQGRPYHGLD